MWIQGRLEKPYMRTLTVVVLMYMMKETLFSTSIMLGRPSIMLVESYASSSSARKKLGCLWVEAGQIFAPKLKVCQTIALIMKQQGVGLEKSHDAPGAKGRAKLIFQIRENVYRTVFYGKICCTDVEMKRKH